MLLFPAYGNAKQVPAKLSSAAAPYSCYILLFLPFAPTIQHRDGPCAPVVALLEALDEADFATSVVIVWGVSTLSALSPF